MNVGNSSHGDKGDIMQEPADHGIEAGVVDVINVVLLELSVTALPANGIPNNHEAKDDKRSGRCPIDERISKKEGFNSLLESAKSIPFIKLEALLLSSQLH